MGIIDPMAINSAVATGMVVFNGGPAVWLALVGVVVGAFGGLAFSAASQRPTRRRLPRLQPRLGAPLASRAR